MSAGKNFASGISQRENLEYIENLYLQYENNPESVGLEWQRFFQGVDFGAVRGTGLSEKELDVYHLITAYRNYGHFEADLDPLSNTPAHSEQLSISKYNLTEADLESTFQIGSIIGKPNAKLRDIIAYLRSVYCGKLTVQVAEALPEVRNWFIQKFEQEKTTFKLSADEKKNLYHSLTRAESLEKFIHTRYVGTKRFSIEGGDALLPMMETLASRCLTLGAEELVVGMAHRGRVNILANFMGKALEYIFADFNGPTELTAPIDDFDGDVKYHLGYTCDKETANGKCHISLAFNPSHLEAVNPVVLGMARAAQRRRKDTEKRKKVIPVLIHGDAAFAGQGVGLETFQMSQVKGYTVGGSIHIAIDNQVGFTTNPENARSSHYCTDVAKVVGAPVMHCNGDDVESCVRAMDIALRYRQEWGRDVVINVVCYRRFGHNEGDEPAYTQPLMYDIIKQHATPREIYMKQLMREGVIDTAFADAMMTEKMDNLQKIYEHTKLNPPKISPVKFEGYWQGLRKGNSEDFEKTWDTSVPLATLAKIGDQLGSVPAGFTPHPKLIKLLESRKAMGQGKENLDWGMGELLAYGSLMMEGNSVRLSGQDCVRGTFTHRHAGLYDFKTGEQYVALKQINPGQTEFCVYDSILSEYAVMGFEYGNAICDPTFLTIWEAQFGDFSNGAQIIIDQFLTAGEAKWQQMCGLVLLLPHGYEGQGPEHSSARLERFLQMGAQNNIQVMNLTTPAQIFHAMRRQVRRPFRKPLVIMSPKSLLRHPRAVSNISELATGAFQEIIADKLIDAKKTEVVVLCSGKVYYDLLEEQEKTKNTRTALVRVEQLYPFPSKRLAALLKTYPNLKTLVWAQEEPKNMGGYQNVYFKISEVLLKEGLAKLSLHYVGRGERSSPATGSIYRHKAEQAEIVKTVFSF
jgi:2-oxoglutarate dehydrogenase E1 component